MPTVVIDTRKASIGGSGPSRRSTADRLPLGRGRIGPLVSPCPKGPRAMASLPSVLTRGPVATPGGYSPRGAAVVTSIGPRSQGRPDLALGVETAGAKAAVEPAIDGAKQCPESRGGRDRGDRELGRELRRRRRGALRRQRRSPNVRRRHDRHGERPPSPVARIDRKSEPDAGGDHRDEPPGLPRREVRLYATRQRRRQAERRSQRERGKARQPPQQPGASAATLSRDDLPPSEAAGQQQAEPAANHDIGK